MDDKKTYEVSFTATVPASQEWEPCHWEDSEGSYLRIDPNTNDPYICVPANAVITQVANPIEDGFYLDPLSRTLYHRIDDEWLFWDLSSWCSSSIGDKDPAISRFERINAVA